MLVIGIVGGVGSGKSTLARALARLGCVVSDSDADARAILQRAEVRDELVGWWGPGILDADGRVDRGKVAGIVFAQPAERAKLEGLTHPLIRLERAQRQEQAQRDGARAFVIDAPLLFEAGLDRECDVVLFVEAPEAARLARVQATRGWDEAELARREASQLPLKEKRERSDVVVENRGSAQELEAAAEKLLTDLLARGARGARRRLRGP